MAFKFALILAVFCVSQGLAIRPMGGFLSRRICKEGGVSKVFKDIVEEMDEMRESFAVDFAQANVQGVDPNVIFLCFEEQRENYIKLGEHIHGLIQTGASQLAEQYGEQFAAYGKRMAEPFRNISNAVREFPTKMMEFIERGDFIGAYSYAKKTRQYIAQNAEVISQVVDEMSLVLPEAAKMAEEIASNIRNEAVKGRKTIREAVEKCIAAGGPNKVAEEN